MVKVDLYMLDTNQISLESLLENPLLKRGDIEESLKYQDPTQKKEHLASRILKNKYVGVFYFGENFKPKSDNCFFNVSHSLGLVVLALNYDYEIGVDVEGDKERGPSLAKYIMSEEEYSSGYSLKEIWTVKESMLKSVGLRVPNRFKEIPALPLNGVKKYRDKIMRTKTFVFNEYYICVCLLTDEDFSINIIEER